MRVITGSARGRPLKSLRGQATRPTTELLKGALFNMIGPDIEGKSFLDLYAGTGGVGIEALSRGASRAVFIDSSPEAVKVIADNLRSTGLSERGRAYLNTVRAAVDILSHRDQKFDYIFLDPPYEKGYVAPTLAWIADAGLLAPAGVVIAEHSRREPIREPNGFVIWRETAHGDSVLTFLICKEEH